MRLSATLLWAQESIRCGAPRLCMIALRSLCVCCLFQLRFVWCVLGDHLDPCEYPRYFEFEYLPRLETLVLSNEDTRGRSVMGYEKVSHLELDLNRMPSLDHCELRQVIIGRITAAGHRGLSRLLVSDCGPMLTEVDVRGCENLCELDIECHPACLVRTEGSGMTGGSSRGPRADGCFRLLDRPGIRAGVCSSAMNKPGKSGVKPGKSGVERLPRQRLLAVAPAEPALPEAAGIGGCVVC